MAYLDESGFKSHENRPYGYSKQGFLCFGTYNWQIKNQTNAMGAIYKGQLFAVGLFDCKINSEHGHQILWLPAYSPDLNPIEKLWGWIKKKKKKWLIDLIDLSLNYFFIFV